MRRRGFGIVGGICFLLALAVGLWERVGYPYLDTGVFEILCYVGLLLTAIGLLVGSRVTAGIGGIFLTTAFIINLVRALISSLLTPSGLMDELLLLVFAVLLMLACFIRPASTVLGILAGVFRLAVAFVLLPALVEGFKILGFTTLTWLPAILQGVGAIFLGISFGKRA